MVIDALVFLWPKSAILHLMNDIYINTGQRNFYFKEQNPDRKNLEAHGNSLSSHLHLYNGLEQ